METTSYISYYRVSTAKQGQSGLGLEAQREAVRHFLEGAELLAEFTEIESGKKNKRAQLVEALRLCKATGATLVIAKLDRLSRNAAFVLELQAAKVPFVCCDNPHANSLTISLLAVIAQHEREQTSIRTKAALGVKRAQSGEWRACGITAEARAKGLEVRRQNAEQNENTRRARGYARAMREGGMGLRAIADRLNTEGHKTARGGAYSPMQVSRLLEAVPSSPVPTSKDVTPAQAAPIAPGTFSTAITPLLKAKRALRTA